MKGMIGREQNNTKFLPMKRRRFFYFFQLNERQLAAENKGRVAPKGSLYFLQEVSKMREKKGVKSS